MSDYKVTDSELTSIANAIRTKGGTSSQLVFPNGFVSAVNAIPTGGGGGGDVVAFVRVIYELGQSVTASDGTTTLYGDTSGNYIFELPSTGTWTFLSNGHSRTINISYGDSLILPLVYLMNTSSSILAEAYKGNFDPSQDVWGGLTLNSRTNFSLVDGEVVSDSGNMYFQTSNSSRTVYFVCRAVNITTSRIVSMSTQQSANGALPMWFCKAAGGSSIYMYDNSDHQVNRSPFVTSVFSISLNKINNVGKWYLNGVLTRTSNKSDALGWINFNGDGSGFKGKYVIDYAAIVDAVEDDATIIANHQNLMTIFGVTT